jgi:hypothetical protein
MGEVLSAMLSFRVPGLEIKLNDINELSFGIGVAYIEV